jgi:serine/threonine protein kinase
MTEATKDATQKDEKIINAADFSFMDVIGEGGYGKVWKIEHLKTRKQYAMKEMSKAAIIMKKSVDNVLNERRIL